MAALDYLRRAGLTVESVADRLRVSPVERITDPIRHFIREHLCRAAGRTERGQRLNAPSHQRAEARRLEDHPSRPADWLHGRTANDLFRSPGRRSLALG